jgi:hypothetical protein
MIMYIGVLISLWLFLFPICSTTKRIFVGWDKEVRTNEVISVWSSGGNMYNK